MKKDKAPLPPTLSRQAKQLGERLARARLRRKISSDAAAVRARTSRSTLSRLENGDPSVSLDLVIRLLAVYGLADDLDLLARDDELGRALQDANLRPVRRVRSRK